MKIENSNELIYLNNNIDIPVGDELNLYNLSYFIPVQIKNIGKLDVKFTLMHNGYQGQYLRDIYKSIDQDYKLFHLNPSSWKRVFIISFQKEDLLFESLSIDLYRGAQDYVILKISLTTSEELRYDLWKKIRRKYNGTKIIHKKYTSYQSDYQNQENGIYEYFDFIEKKGNKHIKNYFDDVIDYVFHLDLFFLF